MPQFTLPAGTRIRTVDHVHESSAKVIVVSTAIGSLYLKGPPAPDGDTMLLREWAGTKLADAFGLQTLFYGLMQGPLAGGDADVTLSDGNNLRRDVVFASKQESGVAWEGGPEQLEIVGNASAFSRLVVFDTWIRNSDRFVRLADGREHANIGNVFISGDAARSQSPVLLAVDHTHVFGSDAVIDAGAGSTAVRDETVYGMFPLFRPHISEHDVCSALNTLSQMSYEVVRGLVGTVPTDWGMTPARTDSLANFLVERARFLCTGGRDRFL